MTRYRNLSGLIALNTALLIILALVTMVPGAGADASSTTIAGDYIMVGGEINGATSNAVYVMDQRSGYIVGMLYDRSKKKLIGLKVRDINDDARRVGPTR